MPTSPASRTTPPAPPTAASTADRSAPMASRLPTSMSAGTPPILGDAKDEAFTP